METEENSIGVQTIKLFGESVGVTSLPEDACRYVAEQLKFHLKDIVQDAAKFMRHSNRPRLSPRDIDSALRAKRIEPLYGFTSTEYLPWRFASGGGRELHFNEDREIDLQNFLETNPVKIPPPVKIRAHWLVIDGCQPNIPENPAPAKKPPQDLTAKKMPEDLKDDKSKDKKGDKKNGEKAQSTSLEQKPLMRHELSIEQMKYYQEITQAAVGRNEEIRKEALNSLAEDTGIHAMLPRFTNFISEGIKCNINENNLALIIYLMRMVKALLDNPTLSLDMYLHELIPVVISCVVSRQLCQRRGENHWALRMYAARVLAQISKNFTTTTSMLQTRIVQSLQKPLDRNDAALAQLYGSIVGLSELGSDVIRRIIIPRMRAISDRIQEFQNDLSSDPVHGDGVDHILDQIKRKVIPELAATREPPFNYDQLMSEFGSSLGHQVYQELTKM